MLKALLKKQFMELNTFYFMDKKTGKARSKSKVILFIGLYVLLFALLGIVFFFLAAQIADAMVAAGLDWLFFAFAGMASILMGTFGSVFNTYAGLYHGKDNELLLSMPIPPSKILMTRLIGVYAMGLMYEALVFIPAMIAYWVVAPVTLLSVVCPILVMLLIGFFILTLTCALGWVVAVISSKLKNKSFVTVLLSLTFLTLYYTFFSKISEYIQTMLSQLDKVSDVVRTKLFPFYHMGLACTGKPVSVLITAAIVLVLFVLTCLVLSRSFVKIATTNRSGKKKTYKVQTMKSASVRRALLHRERRRFTSSPTYMLNCGLGLVLVPAFAIFLVVKVVSSRSGIAELMDMLSEYSVMVPVALAAIVCMGMSIVDITAPSVSLEGKSLWIAQTLPVTMWDVLKAKLDFHILLSVLPGVLCVSLAGWAFSLDIGTILLMLALTLAFIVLIACVGLTLNLLRPNLTWTNETVPVKQGMSVGITLFGGWAVSIVLGGGYYFLFRVMAPWLYLLLAAVVLGVIDLLLARWLKTRGADILKNL